MSGRAETEVLLVRHGETAFHAGNRYCGRTDVPLTEHGLRQAAQLSAWAATAELSAVYSSPLIRAVRTAELAARASGVPYVRDERLRELDFGRAEGLTSAEMRQRWPERRAAFEADPVAHPLPGGEDPVLAIGRGVAAVQEMVDRHAGGTVLVVCHSTLLRLVTCRLTGLNPSGYRVRFPIVHNVSGAVLWHGPDRGMWRLVAFNPVLSTGGEQLSPHS